MRKHLILAGPKRFQCAAPTAVSTAQASLDHPEGRGFPGLEKCEMLRYMAWATISVKVRTDRNIKCKVAGASKITDQKFTENILASKVVVLTCASRVENWDGTWKKWKMEWSNGPTSLSEIESDTREFWENRYTKEFKGVYLAAKTIRDACTGVSQLVTVVDYSES